MSPAESEEQTRLDACQQRIGDNLEIINTRLREHSREIKDANTHMGEARRDMDHIDKVALRQAIEQKMRAAENLRTRQEKLLKLRRSPYFGRFDFAREGRNPPEAVPVYVGVHDFRDEASGNTLVYDWRAPVASLFYDFELGPARYQAPSGEIAGRLERKRQFRIREGRLEFMLESGVNIVDSLLQQQLSHASDDRMKNIVATIQRDQNAIIRDADVHTLIIQGVAGSGKTSIALHRIAFLLYRFKDTLSSRDILIISPNRVFADYIGNVLPELGEEQVAEIGMEALAGSLLGAEYRFQSFFEQTALLLENDDAALRERITTKATLKFLASVDAYAEHLESISLVPAEWRIGRCIVPDWHFATTWQKYRGMASAERIAHLVSATEHQIFLHYRRELDAAERRDLRAAVRGMVRKTTLRAAYKGLFDWLGKPDLFRPSGGRLEYADVFPLIYLKMRLEPAENPYREVKHLLVDEMQDYTPAQYAVLGRLFTCKRTILGDASQSVNPCGVSRAEDIQAVLKSAAPVKLTRSYRSSWEIMQLALKISPNDELVPIERHGELPEVVQATDPKQAMARLLGMIDDFQAGDHNSLAIIAKTQTEAARIYRHLGGQGRKARLLSAESSGFFNGIVVCTAYMAKGLEFDRVIIPDASARNYHTEMDRNLLYVACTRAMHGLSLITVGEAARWLAG